MIVTATKKKEPQSESSEDESSARSKTSEKEEENNSQQGELDKDGSSVESESESDSHIKMSATNFDVELKHLCTNYFYAAGDQHDIRQAFLHEGILTYESMIDMCDLAFLKLMKRKQGGTIVEAKFTNGKLKLVNDVIKYNSFIYMDNQKDLADHPVQWSRHDFKTWRTMGCPLSTAAYTASQPSTSTNSTTQATNVITPKSMTQVEDDALTSWRKSRQNETLYPTLESDINYPEWRIQINRRFTSDECLRIIDLSIHKNSLSAGSDVLLWEAQENYLVNILERVLKTSEGLRLMRKYPDDPRLVWKLHEAHSTSSTTSANISADLSQQLAKMKITEFDTLTGGLDKFDSNLQKLNKISNCLLPDKMAIMFLKSATCGNRDLLSAWAQCVTMREAVNKPPATYDEFYLYLLDFAKRLEASVSDNTTSRKANSAESHFLSQYAPSDDCFDDATDLSTFMADQGQDVDYIHHILQCNQAMKQGKSQPQR